MQIVSVSFNLNSSAYLHGRKESTFEYRVGCWKVSLPTRFPKSAFQWSSIKTLILGSGSSWELFTSSCVYIFLISFFFFSSRWDVIFGEYFKVQIKQWFFNFQRPCPWNMNIIWFLPLDFILKLFQCSVLSEILRQVAVYIQCLFFCFFLILSLSLLLFLPIILKFYSFSNVRCICTDRKVVKKKKNPKKILPPKKTLNICLF